MIHAPSIAETAEGRALRRGTPLEVRKVRKVRGRTSARLRAGLPVEACLHESASR
jgi:hypothetical protein